MTLRFQLVETSCRSLWDFGWFDLSRFCIEGSSLERQEASNVLHEFLQHPISQRSFCDPGSWGESVDRHGPLLRAERAIESFRPISPCDLVRTARATMEDRPVKVPLSIAERAPVEAWIESIAKRGDEAFMLAKSDRPGTRVEWKWIWTVYCEFICISTDRAELTVAVIGED